MRSIIKHSCVALLLCTGIGANAADLPNDSIMAAINTICADNKCDEEMVSKGVKQVATLWQESDGTSSDFLKFCVDNYIKDDVEREAVFNKVSHYFEALWGHFNEQTLQLQLNLHLNNGPLHAIDPMFGAYSPGAHLISDFYNNKIGFIIALNFPELTLKEKENLGNDRQAWAYARLGDVFTKRIPSETIQNQAQAESNADVYISSYNIYMGHVFDRKGAKLFAPEMVLLSHWNLRDEIKANYSLGKKGVEKQRTVYEVMKRIIDQQIPLEVINSDKYDWNPFTNQVTKDGKEVKGTPETAVRYQKMLDNFHAMQKIDQYTGTTYIDRKFNSEMEVALEDAEALFNQFLSSPELKEVGKLIAKRLGRKLEAYDIWYDGFKARSGLDEKKLDEMTQTLYPTAEALKAGLPQLLLTLGFTPERAAYLCDKISVDGARGSGHAWGASMKGQQSRLRTRIGEKGMNYKGYNIAVHEFGHNVEQTISMYDVDNYMMAGVPNTSFTEALAFIFQKRDLQLLGIEDNNPEKADMEVLDKFWSTYEIMGVSMLDIAVWKWMYENPDANAEQLRETVMQLSKEVWNKYFADVFGTKDETILGVYSHMISYPLYLSAYAFGQVIDFQVDNYLSTRNFATEVDRMYKLGRLTPNQWMLQATGKPLSVEPMLTAVDEVLKRKK